MLVYYIVRVFGFGGVYTKGYSDSQPFTHINKSEEIPYGNGYQTICRFAHPRRTSTICRPQIKGQKGFRCCRNRTVSWTDDEVELLLGVVCSYSSQKDYEWESAKSKCEDRRKSIRIRRKNCLHYKTLRIEQQ